jgi:anti-sigma factor RsiW
MAMSDNHTALSEREEIEMLLPWYAAGTLNRAETSKVEAYLGAHPEVASQLPLVREELAETIGVNESLGAPAPGALDRLMTSLEAESGPLKLSSRAPESLWQRLSDWIGELSPRPLALAAAVAVTIMGVQAVMLGVLVTGDGSARFQTASGSRDSVPAATGTFALVGFAGTAAVDDINALLESRGVSIVEGPLPGGLYRIRLSDKELSTAERDGILGQLRAESGVVAFAAPGS